ncbi:MULTISPECIES: glucosidase [unclassified Mucilaginibacter]|uniref:MGH1-like glycoside hydrolase domain-containing protein n=1 Tax=unclassified Mucilaginibacter TaxID=2617802 RepID=UPI002AC9778E|nr:MULTISPECIES: glucosidase [unclassified Mucilaginibacter]MEB0262495.1 glucosidase [Mucilaginibacter sp. 10I4]MEB0279935.1 glucosidase [Mucilaginibacter sp. 10B2]MEB0300081.1 glucosidase [Mucilaginibacter sp. 5C4]WPX21893.1 glucosidase [Mucilaginibacter sp. 5C4]
MGAEQDRLKDTGWKKWGPYVSDRQWGTVREDYSADGNAWNYITHDIARSKAYRWGEEGIAGICDHEQLLCFSIALWNKKDTILKERFFGLSNAEGNHGEDVKELYYYLDNTPTHSYMKMLYKYPQQQFPYVHLVDESKKRNRNQGEYELMDTGIFNNDEYFDVFVEYAKQDTDDILVKITIHNRSKVAASLNVLPTVWFRNTWEWGYDDYKPQLSAKGNAVSIDHKELGALNLVAYGSPELLFCNNQTNTKRFNNIDDGKSFYKDGINDYIVNGTNAINPANTGTKAAFNYDITIPAGKSITIKLKLSESAENAFDDFDAIFASRLQEADEFYAGLRPPDENKDKAQIQRQAYAGMLWNKQFYYYNIHQWLNGDPAEPGPPVQRQHQRNSKWQHFNSQDIISMPDKWEYPWFAAWDLAFHCVPLAAVDMAFAKRQLNLLVKDWFMHPNGQLPAYEWDFSDANPPVHAMATWKIYQIDKKANNGEGDTFFLERIFHKLMLNFTWWVNRKDEAGNNVFEGGFLGMDNIGVFDRNTKFADGAHLEQADGTSWMAMYSLNLLRIAAELAETNKAYADIASKFFEHFIYISAAMSSLGEGGTSGLWDEADDFFYDQLRMPDGSAEKMRIRSIVGLVPLFATEVLDEETIARNPIFRDRMDWFAANRPDLAGLVSRWDERSASNKHLISLLRGHRMKGILKYMLDENEFLSDYGIRSLSKYHLENPFSANINGTQFSIKYVPAESDSDMFGGNSNWRGPVWIPINYLIIESLNDFYQYYGDELTVECPTGSGNMMSLKEVANEIYRRISKLFLPDENGHRPSNGVDEKAQTDPFFKDHILYYEYFDGDTGRGLGAAHQTGWTGLIANCLYH